MEQTNQLQVTTSLQTVLREQNQELVKAQLFKSSLTLYTPPQATKEYSLVIADQQNPELSKKFIDSCFCPKLSEFGQADFESTHIDPVIELIGKWRMVVGCMKDVEEIQIKHEAIYLINNFPKISWIGINNDLANMIELLTHMKLDLQIPFVVNFSPLFMGQCIESYLRYKNQNIDKMNNELLTKNPPPTETPISERLAAMKEIISDCYRHFQEGFKEQIFNKDVYDFLRKTKRLILTEPVIKSAREYSDRKYLEYAQSVPAKLKNNQPGVDPRKTKDLILRKFGIQYCLEFYFKKTPLQDILNSMTEQEYKSFLFPEKEEKK